MIEKTPDVPERPSLDGLEGRWARRWEQDGTYRFRRADGAGGPAERATVFSIDTPPPTVSGSLHVGSVFSYTHTDIVARFQRMRGKRVFYPMGWDDNGLPTERRVQNYFGVRCDPALPYDPGFSPPERAGKKGRAVSVSRRNFVELCERLTAEDEQAFEELWRHLGLSVDWSLSYTTIGARAQRAAQRSFLRLLRSGEAYQAEAPTLWDVGFRTAVAQAELEDRDYPGAWHRVRFRTADGRPVYIETTRPELLPACVALIAHPDDERYAPLLGSTVTTPIFGVPVPVLAHPGAERERGAGIAMCCTFGDLTDVQWWRELKLPTRTIIGRDGRILASPPPGLDSPGGVRAYAELAGATVAAARERIVAMLRASGDTGGEPRPVVRPVKFYEKGDRPLEIVSSRQWFIRSVAHREAMLARGAELTWHPAHMQTRYADWVRGLNSDWLISRQRFFGVPFPVWYPLDSAGEPRYDQPILAPEDLLPVDPSSAAPPGYEESSRGRPGGFTGDPDVMDTWATSSLSPQITCGWGEDPVLYAQTFPMDMRPQGPEIIRTWLFYTVLRSQLQAGVLPWRHAAISGWVLDPDRKKMSKSKGNVVTPMDLLGQFGSDAVRYWAASARPGTDTTFDLGQVKVGRRLAIKVLNVAKFILGLPGPAAGAEITEALDRAMLASLESVAMRATVALEGFEYTAALEAIERFFWQFCDDYVELVKQRAYDDSGAGRQTPPRSGGPGAAKAPMGAESARLALRSALSMLLRLLAPYLPYVAEEAWSWWHDDPVHTSPWPAGGGSPALPEGRPAAQGGVPAGGALPEGAAAAGDGAGDGGAAAGDGVLALASTVIGAIRKAKSDARLSMRAPVDLVRISGDRAQIEAVASVGSDLRSAGNIAELRLGSSSGPGLNIEVTLAPR
jgi:valyl-tRNA synthetase